jgi:hypothetical protein
MTVRVLSALTMVKMHTGTGREPLSVCTESGPGTRYSLGAHRRLYAVLAFVPRGRSKYKWVPTSPRSALSVAIA